MELTKALNEVEDKIELLEIVKEYLDLATELCLHSTEEELSEKCINLIRDRFSEVKDKLKDGKIFEKLLESKDVRLLLGFDRKRIKKLYLKLISECEDTILRRDFSKESREKFMKLYELVSLIGEEINRGIQRNVKILALLAQIENVCLVLKRFEDFNICIEQNSLENLIWFARVLIRQSTDLNLVLTGSPYCMEYLEVIDIPRDDWVGCLLHLYKLFESMKREFESWFGPWQKEYAVRDFLLLLSVTSEVLKNEGLSAQNLDEHVQIFRKIFGNVRERVSVTGEKELKSLREGLVNYLSSALRVSRTFNIDNEMNYHTYIIDKLLSSHIIGIEGFKKVANLYKTIVDELIKEKEYGDKYILSLLRLIVIAIIQQRLYRAPATLTESRFIQILLEIIKLVNKMCDKDAIKNFDKMLNYSIYSADLEYLEGFIDFLYSLYLQSDYEGFRNALKSLNFF